MAATESSLTNTYALRQVLGAEFPPWYKQPVYPHIFYADDTANPQWMLTGNGGEAGPCIGQGISDVTRRIVYQLPCEEFGSMLVDQRPAWLGSPLGVTRIDLDTLQRTDYTTLPVVMGVVDVLVSGGSVYYGTVDAGAFIVNRNDGSIRSIESINRLVRQYRRLGDMVFHGGKLFFLLSSVNRDGWFGRRNLLLAIDEQSICLACGGLRHRCNHAYH